MVIDVEDALFHDIWIYVKLHNFIYRILHDVFHYWFSGSYFNSYIHIILKTYFDGCALKVVSTLLNSKLLVYFFDPFHGFI